MRHLLESSFFFFNDTATTEIYTLSLHDALPISPLFPPAARTRAPTSSGLAGAFAEKEVRSEEHTSELQSRLHLVCRLLLEKKKKPNFSRPPVRGGGCAARGCSQAPSLLTQATLN